MASGAINRRTRDEKSQSRVEKPLLGWWNKATTLEVVGGGPVG